jgi:hypothetical protein
MRAYGAGIPAFYSPVGVGTEVARGKEERVIRGKRFILEQALGADFAFIKAHRADSMGNLVYRKAARNFNPIMATAAATTIVEVDEIGVFHGASCATGRPPFGRGKCSEQAAIVFTQSSTKCPLARATFPARS